MRFIRVMGGNVVSSWRNFAYILSVAASVFWVAHFPRYWSRAVRNVLARQILFTGYQATKFVSILAFLVGVSVVVQAQLVTSALGQKEYLGPILVMVIFRELGPLLVNFMVIARSGTAMASELATMRVTNETHVLDAQGIDPFVYLVMPRVAGAAISIFCLTVIFIFVSMFSGFFVGTLLGVNTDTPWLFLKSVFAVLTPADVFNLIAKTIIPGALMGAICCIEGLKIRGMSTEVPQAASRAVVKSILSLFITSALISVLMYI